MGAGTMDLESYHSFQDGETLPVGSPQFPVIRTPTNKYQSSSPSGAGPTLSRIEGRIKDPHHASSSPQGPRSAGVVREGSREKGLAREAGLTEFAKEFLETGSTQGSVQAEVLEDKDTLPMYKRQSFYIRFSLFVFLLAVIVFLVVDFSTTQYVKDFLEDFLRFIQDLGAAGPFLFSVFYVVCTILFIPGSVLTIGAGFVFTETTNSQVLGTLIASVTVIVGATIGSVCSFLLGRYIFRESVTAMMVNRYRMFAAIDRAMAKGGLRLNILLRLSPLIPFNAFNYLMGTTAVTLRDFTLGCVGIIPGTIAFCYLGSALSSIEDAAGDEVDNDGVVKWILLSLGIAATIVAVILVSYYAKQQLNAMLEEEQGEEEGVLRDACDTDTTLEEGGGLGQGHPAVTSPSQGGATNLATAKVETDAEGNWRENRRQPCAVDEDRTRYTEIRHRK